MGWSVGSAQRLWAVIGLVLAWLQRLLRRLVYLLLRTGPIPQHIAFIMDGNRRFAEQCHLDRMAGHLQGYKKVTMTATHMYMPLTCMRGCENGGLQHRQLKMHAWPPHGIPTDTHCPCGAGSR